MTVFDIPLPPLFDPGAVVRLVEAACADAGLTTTMKGTLRAYPGCIHWHYKRGRVAGVLEVTYWPSVQRLWLSVQAGRVGAWTAFAVTALAETLANSLRTHHDAV
jgi:hypothetical protein